MSFLPPAKERLQFLDNLYPVWEPHTLWTRFDRSAQRFAQQDYIVFEDCSFTYAQTRAEVDRLTRGLYALGVQPGDHAAILLSNCPEFLFLIFALSRLGAVSVPLNARTTRESLVYMVNHAQARWLISSYTPDAALLAGCPDLERVILINENKLYRDPKVLYWPQLLGLGEPVSQQEVDRVSAGCQDPDNLASILFTSGSTSEPKGVMLTHDMLLRSAYGAARSRAYQQGRRIYIPVPLYHAYAYVEGALALLHVGGALIMSRLRFQPENALRILRDFRANDMLLLGSLMMKMLGVAGLRAEDYPDLLTANYATATPDWIWDATRKAFGLTELHTGMGMTELSGCGVVTRPDTPPDYVRLYDGLPKDGGCAAVPGWNGAFLQFKICDPDTGETLPAGQEGEIYYRGPVVTKGYYRAPEATRRAFTPDGWLKSGDIGDVTTDGYLTFRGRLTDAYKVNGENVSPIYVDSVIGKCPLVAAVETVGVSHPQCGEVGAVFLELTDRSDAAKQAVQEYCRRNLSRYQVPKYYFYSDSDRWPRTGTNKISKKELRRWAERLTAESPEENREV